jgi:hypothetical protein
MNPSNTVSVVTLIEEIQSELKGQTGSWRKVSELLNQADVEFGFGTDEMKQILEHCINQGNQNTGMSEYLYLGQRSF